MFKSYYQGGAHVEIFSAQGKDPAAKWKLAGKVQRIFDKSIKSYVYMLEGGPGTKMQLPRDEKQVLSLTQPFLILQLCVPLGVGFSLQLMVTDALNSKRRIFLSSAHKDISHTPLHTRLPLGMLTRGQWVNLAVNVSSIVTGVFHTTLRSTELISISASCKLRKVFTMRLQPHNTNTGIYSPGYDGPMESLPKSCILNVGTVTQVVDICVISQWVQNQQPKITRDIITKSAPQNPLLRSKPDPRNAHSADHQRSKTNKANKLDSLEAIKKPKAPKPKHPARPTPTKPIVTPSRQLSISGNSSSSKPQSPRYNPKRLQSVKSDATLGSETSQSRDYPPTNQKSASLTRDLAHTNQKIASLSRDLSLANHNPASVSHDLLLANHKPASVSRDYTPEPVQHSTPNPLMDRLDLEISFSSPPGGTQQDTLDNRQIIDNITNGNLTFRSTSTQSYSPVSRGKVYNSKDYEDDEESNPFAASDEDLKYRMKALALYNGELEDSMDFSITSRKSKRSMGVGPPPLRVSDEEVEEKLGEDTDMSSSDATVLSYAQELLLSGGVGHTSFLQDSIGNSHENRLTEQAYSPPICYPDELTRQATLPQHTNMAATITEVSDEEELELLYDPVLNCYFDPKTCKYYELA